MDKYYIKREWQKKIVILIVSYLVVIIFLNLFFILNKVNKLDEIEGQKKILIEEQRFISLINSITEESKNFIYEIKRSLEEKKQFFQVVDTISKDIGLKIRDIQEVQFSQQEGNFKYKTYVLTFSSSFKKVGEFILSIEKQPNFLIRKLSISSNRKEPFHNVELHIEVYNI